MLRQENIETASTVTSIIPASTVIPDHNSTVIITQNNQQEPFSSELINLDISNTLQKAKNLAKTDDTILPLKRADTATRSLSRHLQSQPEGLQQCTAAQRVPDPCRSVERLHELIPDCKKIPGSSQHLQVTQWMASIDGKEQYDAFKSRIEEKKPTTTKESDKTSPSGQKQQSQREKEATSSEQGQREGTSPKALQPGIQDSKDSAGFHEKFVSYGQNHDGITEEGGSQIKIPEMMSDIFDSIPELYEAINDVKKHLSDKNDTICNKIKTNSLSLCQINETLMCFGKVLRAIKTSNNDNFSGNKINEQSAIIEELTEKYSKLNVDNIIETRIKQAIDIIKTDNKKVLDDISN
ncbi:hypothetical protein O181_127274 [Austropuccinia psidii MF-1]|uniref:Uncharacterized protein n=1 Tax=Austropuccinia psidii MF-1 TaxID=1389203 RepID=A0A9Q3KXQ7_9BASI|nr:hypothetical protein [Austropuccinia psidii MF-1]